MENYDKKCLLRELVNTGALKSLNTEFYTGCDLHPHKEIYFGK